VSLDFPTYRQTGSALHRARPGVAIAYLAVPCAVALLFDHPLVLAAALVGVVAAARGAGLSKELVRATRLALPLAALVALVNPLVNRQGLTVILSGPVAPVLGRLDVTLEALVYGGMSGLRVLVAALAFALYSAAVDPDEVLRLFRRLSFRSSLTASLATRLVPVLGRDAQRLGEAYRLRAERPDLGGGRLGRLRRAAVLTRALAAGALERAIELASALEVRGYGSTSRTRGARERPPWSRHDRAFAASGVAAMSLALAARLWGVARFDPYPLLRADLAAVDVAFAAFLSGLPCRARREADGGPIIQPTKGIRAADA
jgi:energy-coupling factor transport system permease protein